MLAPRGRLAVLAPPGQPRVTFDLLDLYHNEGQLFGVDTLKRDMSVSAYMLDAISPGSDDSQFDPPVIAAVMPLEAGVAAYEAVAAGTKGWVVLVPGAR